MLDKVREDILKHAHQELKESGRECCGLVVLDGGREVYVPCRNAARGKEGNLAKDTFLIDPLDYANAADLGEVVAVVHSHIGTPATPSQPDLIAMRKDEVPWIIAAPLLDDVQIHFPPRDEIPLIGREYSFGSADCFTLMQDYFRIEHGIYVHDRFRTQDFDRSEDEIILDNFEEHGFVEVPACEMKEGDVILMQCSSNIVNHIGIYAGDNVMLHHCAGHPSKRSVYGSYWRNCTRKVVRHHTLTSL